MNKPFSFFSLASFISIIGDQIALIAFPWFILSISEKAWVVGLGLGIIGIPRAFAILTGGVFTDKYSPKKVLIFSRACSTLFAITICILLTTGSLGLTLFVLFAGLFSIANAIGFPASPTMLTQLVEPERYHVGNAILMGLAQVAGLIGPLIAGTLLKEADCTHCNSQLDFAFLFLVVGICFLISGIVIALVPVKRKNEGDTRVGFRDHFVEGMRYVKTNHDLAAIFGYLVVANFVIQGCVMVGIPMLVEQSEAGGPFNHGMLMTVLGTGVLFAYATTSIIPQIPTSKFTLSLTIFNLGIAVSILIFFNRPLDEYSYILLFAMGAVSGICQLSTIRYLQTTVDQAYMGRMMSYLLFCIFGLIPLSASTTGIVISWLGTKQTFEILAVILFVSSLGFGIYNKVRSSAPYVESA